LGDVRFDEVNVVLLKCLGAYFGGQDSRKVVKDEGVNAEVVVFLFAKVRVIEGFFKAGFFCSRSSNMARFSCRFRLAGEHQHRIRGRERCGTLSAQDVRA